MTAKTRMDASPETDNLPEIGPTQSMVGAACVILGQQLAILRNHEMAVRETADATGIHEMRKAIRRSRTAFRIFDPYFPRGALKPYRSCLKKVMKRLALSRDLHVFVAKLARYRVETQDDLSELEAFWRLRLEVADAAARDYVNGDRYQLCVATFAEFLRAPPPQEAGLFEPAQVRQLAPVLLYQRLAAVRAFDELIADADTDTLHQLRVQFKELRYTLEFFAGVLGAEAAAIIKHLDEIQHHLGDLNDADVALDLLAKTPGAVPGVEEYAAVQRRIIAELRASFLVVWEHFDDPGWRLQLAQAVAVL